VGSSADNRIRNLQKYCIVETDKISKDTRAFNSIKAAAVNGLSTLLIWLECIFSFAATHHRGASITMVSIPEPRKAELEIASSAPVVSFLGPVSSYTHQVFTFCQF